MKTLSIIPLLLMASLVFGQRSNTAFDMDANDLHRFSRQDFIENNLTEIAAYSYYVNKKGKLKNDSLLLYRQQFDLAKNKLFGLNVSTVYQSHGPSFLTWDEYETYFNNNGQVVKDISRPKDIEKKVEDGFTGYKIMTNEIEYEYDNLNREIKQICKRIDQSYSISNGTKDTLLYLHSIYSPRIDEYIYNSDNQKIKWYHTVDSTRYLKTKSYNPDKDPNAVRCAYCDSKYLHAEWKYDSDKKLIESVSYTTENRIHTKRNYFYDTQQRLVRQIDSTGWYITTIKPYCELITTFDYSDTGKIVTKISNTGERSASSIPKIVSYYDTEDRLIKRCYNDEKTEDCTTHSFFYDNKKLIKEETTLSNGDVLLTEYDYNQRGLLKEERIRRNQKLTRLIRYYYK